MILNASFWEFITQEISHLFEIYLLIVDGTI